MINAKKSVLLSVFGMACSLSAGAHEDRVAMMRDHIPVLLSTFERDQPTARAQFSGLKTWIQGHSVQAKIFLLDGNILQYSCQETGERIQCQALAR